MKRYRFETYELSDGNRAAFELCRGVAQLRAPSGKGPHILIGDEGCGKTHLLYAIVNAVRGSKSQAGLAYITAHDFPAQVRALITDPTPVVRVSKAILLVDQLEQFVHFTDELESLVRLFLEYGHLVVLATNVPVSHLYNLTDGFRAQLREGTALDMGEARVGEISFEEEDSVPAPPPIGSDETIDVESFPQAPGTADLFDDMRRQLTEVSARSEKAVAEMEALRAENALLSVSSREALKLRERIRDLEDASCEPSDQAMLSRLTALTDELSRVREEMKALAADKERVQSESTEISERVEQLLEIVEQSRSRFTQAQQEQRDQVEALAAFLDTRVGELPAPVATVAPQEETLAPLREMTQVLEEARDEIERLESENEHLVTALKERDDTIKALKRDLAEELAELRAELSDAAHDRNEAEEKLIRYQTSTRMAELELQNLHQRMLETAHSLDALSTRFRAFPLDVPVAEAGAKQSEKATPDRGPASSVGAGQGIVRIWQPEDDDRADPILWRPRTAESSAAQTWTPQPFNEPIEMEHRLAANDDRDLRSLSSAAGAPDQVSKAREPRLPKGAHWKALRAYFDDEEAAADDPSI